MSASNNSNAINKELEGLDKKKAEPLILGAMISFVLGGIIASLVGIVFGTYLAIALWVIVTISLFAVPLNKVQTGHVGVLQITGTRVKKFPRWLGESNKNEARLDVVNEGWTYLLPFIMSLEGTVTDLRQQTINFTEGEPEGRAEILCADGKVFLRGSAQFTIFDPFRFLDTRLSIVLNGLPEAILSAIRDMAARESATEVMDFDRSELDKTVKEAIKDRVVRWGIRIDSVNVTEIRLDPALEEAKAQEAIEKDQRKGETEQTKGAAEQIKLIQSETGLSELQSTILYAALTKRNMKMEEVHFNFSGEGANNALNQAAAILRGRGPGNEQKE